MPSTSGWHSTLTASAGSNIFGEILIFLGEARIYNCRQNLSKNFQYLLSISFITFQLTKVHNGVPHARPLPSAADSPRVGRPQRLHPHRVCGNCESESGWTQHRIQVAVIEKVKVTEHLPSLHWGSLLDKNLWLLWKPLEKIFRWEPSQAQWVELHQERAIGLELTAYRNHTRWGFYKTLRF